MSNELIEAAEACRNLAKTYKSVLQLAEAVGDIGALLANRDQVQAQLDVIRADIATENARLADTRRAVEDAQSAAAGIVDAANSEAVATKAKAELEAKAVVDEAQVRSNVITSQADAYAKEVEERIETAKAELVSIGAATDTANAELVRINDLIAEARAKLGA